MELTENRNLRGGNPCWIADDANTLTSDAWSGEPVDVAIVGAGVMGAMLAERLAGQGRSILLLDRRPPAHGSTAASTALVMWGADVPLTHLAQTIGMEEAARRWRRIYAVVQRFAERVETLGLYCGLMARPELYLAGTLLNEAALRAEGVARRAAGLPSDYMEAGDVAARFGIAPRAALLSGGSYEVDPVRLTLGLLTLARQRGAQICFPADVSALESVDGGVRLTVDNGRSVLAGEVILAPGYERAKWFLPAAFDVSSSFAIASPAGMAPLWAENAMIWEASTPYLYARATADGRIIAGGEDEDFDDGDRRDAMIGSKGGVLQAKLQAMVAEDRIPVDCAWAAAFGGSPDGLPAIGRAANHDHLWVASGFGGNGVSFAALGAEMLAIAMDGGEDADVACFDPYRFE